MQSFFIGQINIQYNCNICVCISNRIICEIITTPKVSLLHLSVCTHYFSDRNAIIEIFNELVTNHPGWQLAFRREPEK